MTTILIHNATLIDGTGAAPISNAGILIEDGRIRAVGRADSLKLPNSVITRIDAGGGFILPGLIDAHVHMWHEDFDVMREMTDPLSLNFYRAVGNMRRTIDAGITTVRDAGGSDLGMKMAVDKGLVVGPRMQISITVMSTTGGHIDYWQPSGANLDEMFPYPGRPSGIADGVDGVRHKVREILRSGADIVKICTTGGVMSPMDDPRDAQYSMDELRAIVEEAGNRRHTKVMAHSQGVQGTKNAVRAGIHSIEHGIFLDDEAIELMLEAGTFLVPTLIAIPGILEMHETKHNMPEWGVRKARELLDVHKESIAKAYKAGVKIAMGTDVPVVPHGQNLRELCLMNSVGMSPMETIIATTRTAAECLGWQDRIGTLEAGKLADVVVTKTDPLANLQSLENVENIGLVMKEGNIVKNLLVSPH
jgi:imidazolonepropionase-like amidohydrolase